MISTIRDNNKIMSENVAISPPPFRGRKVALIFRKRGPTAGIIANCKWQIANYLFVSIDKLHICAIIKTERQPIDGQPSKFRVKELTANLGTLGGYFFFAIISTTSAIIATINVAKRNIASYVTISPPPFRGRKVALA